MRPRARHGALDAPGASQAIESCKQQSSNTAGGVSLPVSDTVGHDVGDGLAERRLGRD
jgi:hypothetical protein